MTDIGGLVALGKYFWTQMMWKSIFYTHVSQLDHIDIRIQQTS